MRLKSQKTLIQSVYNLAYKIFLNKKNKGRNTLKATPLKEAREAKETAPKEEAKSEEASQES